MLTKGYARLFALFNNMIELCTTGLFGQQSVAGTMHPDLSRLLFLQPRYECSDPRDRVFALLGFLGKEDRGVVERLLSRGYHMSVADVWCAALKQAIFQSGTLDDLGYERESVTSDYCSSLPS